MIEALPAEATALRFAGVFLGPVGAVASLAITAVIKTFLKSAALARELTPDYFRAMGLSTDVGGLRAFGLTFGQYGISLAPMARAQFSATSTQFAALHIMHIRNADSAEAMTKAITETARYLRTLPEGAVLPMARATALTSLFDEPTIIALRTMSQQDIERLAALYMRRRRMFKLDPQTVKKFVDFDMTLRNAALVTGTNFIKLLTHGHPSLVESMTHLSEAVTKVTVKMLDVLRILNIGIINKLASGLQFISQILNSIRRTAPTAAPGGIRLPPGYGRARLGERVGIARPAPTPGAPTISPGRAQFTHRIGMPTPAYAPSISPARKRFTERIGMPHPTAGAISSGRQAAIPPSRAPSAGGARQPLAPPPGH
jgi:hypothetical protein